MARADRPRPEGAGPAEAAGLLSVARAALAAYDLPRPLEVHPVRLLNNAVFEVVGDDVHLALRVHRRGYRSIGHIRSELRVLQVLADELDGSPVSAPRPVPARDGDLLVSVEDGTEQEGERRRHCDLLTWIHGRVLKHGRGLGPRSTFLLGTALGLLHTATQRLDDLDLPRWDGETMLSAAYDLAPLLGNLFDWPDAYRRLRRAFLEGYGSVRPFPVELERHLPVLMAARHAATLTWLAAKDRRGETDVPLARHVAVRVSEMRRCLALSSAKGS